MFNLEKYNIHLSRRQKIILSIYFILGLPCLPFGLLWPLMGRYLFEDKTIFSPERRTEQVIMICSLMISFTLFLVLAVSLAWCLK